MGFFSALLRGFGWRPKKRIRAPRRVASVSTPKTHLSASVTHEDQEIAANLDGYLRVAAIRSTSQADRMFAARLRERLKEGLELRTMPQAMLNIQRLLAAPDCQIDTLSCALEREPTLASRIVGLANCALYRGQAQLHAVENAVIRIGLKETRNIVMAIACKTKLFRLPGSPEEAEAMYWRALASAVSGRLLARAQSSHADSAFIACMLADLGRIVILSEAVDLRRESRGSLEPTPSFIDHTADHAHAAISALIAKSWGYEATTLGGLLHHHTPHEAQTPPSQELARLIYTADLMAHQLILGNAPLTPSEKLARSLRAMGLGNRGSGLLNDAQREYNEFAHVIDGYRGPKNASQIRGKLMSI